MNLRRFRFTHSTKKRTVTVIFTVQENTRCFLSRDTKTQGMEAKFVFVILCVEIAALYFNIHHLNTAKIDIYNSFDETPININYSMTSYTCFKKVNHCYYESRRLQPINIIHCVFIIVGILAYLCVLGFLIRAYYFRRSDEVSRNAVF